MRRQELSIRGLNLKDQTFGQLVAPLSHLYYLDISNCKELSPIAITDLTASNKSLRTLKMSNCKRAVNDEALTFVASSLKDLQVLDIVTPRASN